MKIFHPRPTFDEFVKRYPSTWEIGRVELFRSIGWDRELDYPAFLDTCAIRGSIGLLNVGVPVKGRMKILKGEHKDKWIEPGQRDLTLWLANHWWGPPDHKVSAAQLGKLIGRHGVISHFRIDPASPIAHGHFDVLTPTEADPKKCASMCHWGAAETWVWELPRGVAS